MDDTWLIGLLIGGTALLGLACWGLGKVHDSLNPQRIEECHALCAQVKAPAWSWSSGHGCQCAGTLP